MSATAACGSTGTLPKHRKGSAVAATIGFAAFTFLGPVKSFIAWEPFSRARLAELRSSGATVLVDGRGATVRGCEGGSYVGPTVIDHVRPDMPIIARADGAEAIASLRAIGVQDVTSPDRLAATRAETSMPDGTRCSTRPSSSSMGASMKSTVMRVSSRMRTTTSWRTT